MEITTNTFKSLPQLILTLNTEKKCLDYLAQLRWNGRPECPNETCYSREGVYNLIERKVLKCKRCGKQFSAKQGTIFHNSKVPMVQWFAAIYIFASKKRAINSCDLAREIGVTQKTAWYMLQKIRVLVSPENENAMLSGTVEGDEAYCGAKKNRDKRLSFKIYQRKELRIRMDAEGTLERQNRIKREENYFEKTGRRIKRATIDELGGELKFDFNLEMLADKHTRMLKYQPIHYRKNILGFVERDEFVMIEREGKEPKKLITKYGKLFLRKVGRHSGSINKESVVPILKKHIRKNSRVMTDKHAAYKGLDKTFKEHNTIKHSASKGKSVQYVDEDIYTNTIENVWNQFKKVENGIYVQYSWKYTDRYLDEFVFRWNYRGISTGEKFNKIMAFALNMKKSFKNFKELNDVKFAYIHIAA